MLEGHHPATVTNALRHRVFRPRSGPAAGAGGGFVLPSRGLQSSVEVVGCRRLPDAQAAIDGAIVVRDGTACRNLAPLIQVILRRC